jgi:hypothetical protein
MKSCDHGAGQSGSIRILFDQNPIIVVTEPNRTGMSKVSYVCYTYFIGYKNQ